MKVIFLDIDGVLNSDGCKASYENVYFVDEKKIKLLAYLVNVTGAKIILSSSWRYGAIDVMKGINSFEADLYTALEDTLEEYDLYIYDCTGISGSTRGDEIDEWIREKKDVIESYVILDDMPIEYFGKHADYLVQTNILQGLEREHIISAIQILND